MRVILDAREQETLSKLLPGTIASLEQQLKLMKNLENQVKDFRNLQQIFETNKEEMTLDKNTRETLLQLLRPHPLERVETLVTKLITGK